jgi:hypothetical protein
VNRDKGYDPYNRQPVGELNAEFDTRSEQTANRRLSDTVRARVQREAYLRKRCTCGSGLGDGLCVNCWPQ